MTHLILTCDYEVFGDGQGDIRSCLLRPVEKLLNTAERRGFPLTLFVDASEFLRMRSEEPLVSRVEAQLAAAVRRGHEVQLHLHPQWDKAVRVDGTWHVEHSRWRIGNLAPREIHAAIERGKAYLESVIESPVDTFRAGAWAIQPSKPVLDALLALNFHMDSTVAPGRCCRVSLDYYDFRTAPDRPWWHVGNEVVEVGTRNLIEVPIATARIPRMRHLASMMRKRQAGTSPEGCTCRARVRQSYPDRMRRAADKLSNLGRGMLDFSSLDLDGLKSVTAAWRAQYDDPQLPVVAISHAKDYTAFSDRTLDAWLRSLDSRQVLPATYRSWYSCQTTPSVEP